MTHVEPFRWLLKRTKGVLTAHESSPDPALAFDRCDLDSRGSVRRASSSRARRCPAAASASGRGP